MKTTGFLRVIFLAVAAGMMAADAWAANVTITANPIDPKALFCVDAGQSVAGYKLIEIPIGNILYEAQKAQKPPGSGFLSPDFFTAFGSSSVTQNSNASTLIALFNAYYPGHESEFKDHWLRSPPKRTTESLSPEQTAAMARAVAQNQDQIGANVFWATREYLANHIFNEKNTDLFAIGPNGAPLGSADWGQIGWVANDFNPPESDLNDSRNPENLKGASKANWLLWQLASGEKYAIGCANYAARDTGSEGGDKTLQSKTLTAGASTKTAGADSPWNSPFSTSSYHVTGARDGLALSSFGLADPLATSPNFSIQPNSTKTSGSSYNITAQGVAGYTVLQSDCAAQNFNLSSCMPWSFTLFGDGFYGQDKNAPKSPGGTQQIINRIGFGSDITVRWDPEAKDQPIFDTKHDWAFLFQFIPEYVTDSDFDAQTLYAELRADVIEAPFDFCTANDTIALPRFGFQINCGAAAILDGAHNYAVGKQPGLFNNFLRIGGEVGVGIAPQPGFCTDSYCELLTEKLSASVWYKILEDIDNDNLLTGSAVQAHNASIHNFTAQLAYNIYGSAGQGGGASGLKSLAVTLQYTDGREDITLFKLPTWSVGFKGAM